MRETMTEARFNALVSETSMTMHTIKNGLRDGAIRPFEAHERMVQVVDGLLNLIRLLG